MLLQGILIDKKYFENLSVEYHKELDKQTAKIYKMAGVEFNINSPKQMGEVLFEKMGMKSSKKKKHILSLNRDWHHSKLLSNKVGMKSVLVVVVRSLSSVA